MILVLLQMHPNRTLLIVKRKARVVGPTGSGPLHSNPVDSFAQYSVPSPEENNSFQHVSRTQQGDDESPKRQPTSQVKATHSQRRVPLGPKKIIFPPWVKVGSQSDDDFDSEDDDETVNSEIFLYFFIFI